MRIAIVGSGLNRAYHIMMTEMGHETLPIRSLGEIRPCLKEWSPDVFLFTGGADVNPELYGHTKHPTTQIDIREDELYEQAFCCALEYGVKFVGICRGSQYLCVKAGGELIQHCDNHAWFGGHTVDSKYGQFLVTSTHHQMQHPKDVEHELLVWAEQTTTKMQHRYGDTIDVKEYYPVDIEVVYYPHIRALAFQPHPEFDGAVQTLELFKKCFKEYIEEEKQEV